MSSTTAVMLQDRLNDIERNICDGIDFRQELNEAYALADELQAENDKLREQGARLFDKTLELGTENSRLREELDAVGMAAYLYGKEQLESENAKLRKESDTLMRRIDELCMENEQLRNQHTAKRIVVSESGVGHCACSACVGAIDQDDAWCRHCGAEFKGDA